MAARRNKLSDKIAWGRRAQRMTGIIENITNQVNHTPFIDNWGLRLLKTIFFLCTSAPLPEKKMIAS
jgi:hypothetical protein